MPIMKYLVRLYDLDSLPEVGITVGTVPSNSDPKLSRPSLGPISSGQRGHLIVCRDGQPQAAIELHPWGACSLGSLTHLENGSDRIPQAILLRLALSHLRWSGYEYCLVGDLLEDPRLFAASVPVHEMGSEPPATRDSRELPWADIYVDLVKSSVPPFPVEWEQPDQKFLVRRPEASEERLLSQWIHKEFGAGWASEVSRAFSNTPISSIIAVEIDNQVPQQRRPVGFICYDSTRRGMVSATAVRGDLIGAMSHIGAALLVQCLHDARRQGYSFVILSGVSRRIPALRLLPGSWTVPGSYPGIFGVGINATARHSGGDEMMEAGK